MRLGLLLEAAAKKKGGAKPAGGVTIKISGGGAGAAAGAKKKPAKRKKQPGGTPVKLGDLLAHAEQSSVHHMRLAGTHSDYVKYHNQVRDHTRFLGPQHATIRDMHIKLADAYRKLGRDSFRLSKVEPKEPKSKRAKKQAREAKKKVRKK